MYTTYYSGILRGIEAEETLTVVMLMMRSIAVITDSAYASLWRPYHHPQFHSTDFSCQKQTRSLYQTTITWSNWTGRQSDEEEVHHQVYVR